MVSIYYCKKCKGLVYYTQEIYKTYQTRELNEQGDYDMTGDCDSDEWEDICLYHGNSLKSVQVSVEAMPALLKYFKEKEKTDDPVLQIKLQEEYTLGDIVGAIL